MKLVKEILCCEYLAFPRIRILNLNLEIRYIHNLQTPLQYELYRDCHLNLPTYSTIYKYNYMIICILLTVEIFQKSLGNIS